MMPNVSEEVWISVAAAARILEKTPQMVRLYADQGKIRSRRIGARGWRELSYDDVCRLRNGNDL